MSECWLKPNRRPTSVALTLGAGVALVSGVVLTLAWRNGSVTGAVLAGILLLLSMLCCLVCWLMLGRARVTYHDGNLIVHDGTPAPIAVPIEFVEAFFLGSGPALADEAGDKGPRTANVVIRIAEGAKQWHNGTLASAIGRWSDGYIVLRGTWCEPIGHDRLNKINHRLAEVHRLRHQQTATNAQVIA